MSEQSTSDFTDRERDATGYFFLRMKAVYGARFVTAYPTEVEIKIAKREWAREIGRYSREDIDRIFSVVKGKQAGGDQSMDWPDIGRILGACADTSEQRAFKARAQEQEQIGQEARKRLTDQGAQERAHIAGNRALATMRAMLRTDLPDNQ